MLALINDRTGTERGDIKYRHLDTINIDELAKFTCDCLNNYSDEAKLEEANLVADVLVQMLVKKKLISETSHQSFVDILIASTLLHNLFYDKEDWTTLFIARQELIIFAEDMKINSQVTDAIFQTIEAQLGEDSPVPACKPSANSPTELFATAVWFVKEYIPQV